MSTLTFRSLAAGLMITALCGPALAQQPAADQSYDLGMLPTPQIFKPQGPMKANVFLFSDADGWNDTEKAEAEALTQKGALVIGIDLPSYIASLNKDDSDCTYMISDIESLAQQVQRSLGNGSYRSPMIAGAGLGGTFVLGMMAQSPPATIGEAVAVDPEKSITLAKELCTPADKTTIGNGIAYGLTDGTLPAPITVYFTSAANADGKSHVEEIQKEHSDIDIETSDEPAKDTLISALSDKIDAADANANPLGLPLTILEAKPSLDTMAIVYSGDGGWRDIDSEVGAVLQEDGVPVVGVDALRYFWSKKTPEETAADLSRMINYYRKQWNVKNVLLVGYSFGADILPSTINRLPPADKSRITMISLLGLSHAAEFEISVSGWFGAEGSGEGGDPSVDLKSIDPKLVQCVYGTEDDEEACRALEKSGVETLGIEGGHHFDEDYEKLAQHILASLKKRLGR